MKKLILALVLIVSMAGVSQAVLPTSEAITVSNTAIGFTASIINTNSVTMATCSVETAQIRFRADGTNPTSSVGHTRDAAQWFCIGNCSGEAQRSSALQQLQNFRAIRATSTDATIFCTYE